jgi:hypothetical protein
VPCGVCARTGRVAGAKLCLICGGSGWRRRLAGEDPFDEYTGEPIADAASSPKHSAPFRLEDDYRKLGQQLEQVQRSIDAREGVYSDAYGWERAREAWERLGSYQSLRAALSALQVEHPQGYSVIRAVHLAGVPARMIGRTKMIEAAAVIWLQAEMPGPIHVPPWLMIEHFRERKLSFVQLVDAGRSASQIARELNLPKKRVKKMLKVSRAAV